MSTTVCFSAATSTTASPLSALIDVKAINKFNGFENRYDAILYTNEQISSGTATVKLQTYHEELEDWIDFETENLSSISTRAIRFYGYIPGGTRMRWTVSSYSSLTGASGAIQLTGLIQLR